MAKETLTERLAKAEAQVGELKAQTKLLDAKVIEAQSRAITLETENNELRDKLMEAMLQQEHMRGYMLRTAEDEPRAPLPVPPDRRYASGPAPEIDHFYGMEARRSYGGSNDKPPRRWYHR